MCYFTPCYYLTVQIVSINQIHTLLEVKNEVCFKLICDITMTFFIYRGLRCSVFHHSWFVIMDDVVEICLLLKLELLTYDIGQYIMLFFLNSASFFTTVNHFLSKLLVGNEEVVAKTSYLFPQHFVVYKSILNVHFLLFCSYLFVVRLK